jgi:site-specific DNA-methyltransferase (adenine-specific)
MRDDADLTLESGDSSDEKKFEQSLLHQLVATGLVKPCSEATPTASTLPANLLNATPVLARLSEVSASAHADASFTSAPPTTTPADLETWLLFEGDPECGTGPLDAIPLPRPAAERLSTLLPIVHKAFCDIRAGWSTDRVLADPGLGDLFLRRCWELGAQASAFDLNWTLLYGRKNGSFSEIGRARRFCVPRARLDEFGHASEMAARYIRQTQWQLHGRKVSLDKILCDPILASQFDAIAARIAPGFSALEYRWSALGLRKAQRSLAGSLRLRTDDFEDLGYTRDLKLCNVPKARGIYCFTHGGEPLFVGHSEGLRRQMSIHFDQCGTRVIPPWLDDRELDVRVAVAPMAGVAPSRRELVRAREVARARPRFNWLGELPAA